MEAFGSLAFVLFITTDDASYQQLTEFKAAFSLPFAVAPLRLQANHTLNDALHIREASYWIYLQYRVTLMCALFVCVCARSCLHSRATHSERLLSRSIDVFLFETDAVWFQCAFALWTDRHATAQLSGIKDGTGLFDMGFGFLRIRATPGTVRALPCSALTAQLRADCVLARTVAAL